MEYLTVRETAEKWKISQRLVQKYCAQGRITGAKKFGASWGIPATAKKPGDPTKNTTVHSGQTFEEISFTGPGLMPLMNTSFLPGSCQKTIEAMQEGPSKAIARAEYYYFSGQPEKAIQKASPYLAESDPEVRLSACLICGFANLSMGDIDKARMSLDQMRTIWAEERNISPQLRAAEAFVKSAAAVLLHLPLPAALPPAQECLPHLPLGLRAFAMYVQAHYFYLQGRYEKSLGIVQATLYMQGSRYPIPAIYLHLVAVMDYMGLRQAEAAQRHLLLAWELARPDDLIQGFGEHHGLLGGMLEAVLKKDYPEDFKRIIDITYRFSAGWRQIHNPDTGHQVADNLTTTEFVTAMLASRGWTNQEIGDHLKISVNTVKRHISSALHKLNIKQRQDLKQYMLR